MPETQDTPTTETPAPKLRLTLTLEAYQDAEESGVGYCLACHAARDGTEADAEGYGCDVCGKPRVMGAFWFLLAGRVR